MIGGDRPLILFSAVFAFGDNRENIFACSGLRAADAYHRQIWERSGAGGKARTQ